MFNVDIVDRPRAASDREGDLPLKKIEALLLEARETGAYRFLVAALASLGSASGAQVCQARMIGADGSRPIEEAPGRDVRAQ